MKLSVIIPVYNVEKYVAKCLDSVLDQGLDENEYEIIVVNDGTPDGSMEIVGKYAKKHKHIHVINKENGGLSSARNCGIDHAKGKYIYFIDSDDYLVSNSLNVLVDTCERHNLNVLTFLCTTFSTLPSDDIAFEGDSFLNDKMLSPVVSGEDYVAYYAYRNEACLYITNREYLNSIGHKFPIGRFLEDAAFTLETFLKAERIAHLKIDAYRYRITPGSILTKKEPTHYLKLIRDMLNAAFIFDPIVKRLEGKSANSDCILRIKSKQQSIVFFSMIRMLSSTMSIEEVKLSLEKMKSIKAYPLDSFLGKDYNRINYKILVPIFNNQQFFYLLFRLVNPILKLKNRFSERKTFFSK
ncbi:MAG TPA: glycosyltransferase [Gelidibacter sp.]|uniref:glycosyltransferase n=1 Tax=Gelidibacter sp. TaxID=2018083 RepID=UPI002CD87610|nr:glycosyltransferase [Gelidibacter sp.]HXJ98330.1 glycosyltransferase [Gelidibacter sp.]